MSSELIIPGGAPALPPQQRAVAPVLELSGRQLALVHRTLAKDTNEDEFNLYIETCKHRGLDPFKKQAYCIVYNKADESRRSMVIIVAIDGLRVIAQRCGNYRPASDPAEVIIREELKTDANPAGIEVARTKLWQFSHGQWWPVIGEARWSEFAPIKMEPEGGYDWIETGETWADSGKPKKKKKARGEMRAVLDDSGLWPKMPAHMLVKCATAVALRAGWPDEYGGLYVEEEADRMRLIDRDATDLLAEQEEEDRLARVRAGQRIALTFGDRWGIEFVDYGRFADRVAEWLQEPERTAEEIGAFASANREGLREFWGYSPSDGLELKRLMEKREAELGQAGSGKAPAGGGKRTPKSPPAEESEGGKLV